MLWDKKKSHPCVRPAWSKQNLLFFFFSPRCPGITLGWVLCMLLIFFNFFIFYKFYQKNFFFFLNKSCNQIMKCVTQTGTSSQANKPSHLSHFTDIKKCHFRVGPFPGRPLPHHPATVIPWLFPRPWSSFQNCKHCCTAVLTSNVCSPPPSLLFPKAPELLSLETVSTHSFFPEPGPAGP